MNRSEVPFVYFTISGNLFQSHMREQPYQRLLLSVGWREEEVRFMSLTRPVNSINSCVLSCDMSAEAAELSVIVFLCRRRLC